MDMAPTDISNIPDCILQYIVSLLPSKDAVRTSLLAKRWRNFWTFLSILELRPDRYIRLDYPNDIRFPLLKKLYLSRAIFVENSAQRLFSGFPVLEELTLDDCDWYFGLEVMDRKQITIAFSTLRILTIYWVPDCYNYLSFKINAVNLISLSYTSPVELLPVNLTSVVDVYLDHFQIEDAVHGAHCAIQLLSGLNSVKSLTISNDTLEFLDANDTLHLLPSFHNLTHLHVLSGQNYGASKILKDFLPKTPKLEVLKIPEGLDGEIWTLKSMPCCFKSSLKLVCISDFEGDEDQIELVRFFLENATTVREIQIFWETSMKSNLEMLSHIENQLQPSPFSKCVITFQ